jgi:hypothetical protein
LTTENTPELFANHHPNFWLNLFTYLDFEAVLNLLATCKFFILMFKEHSRRFESTKPFVYNIAMLRSQKKIVAGLWLDFFKSCTLIATDLHDFADYLAWNDHPNIFFPDGYYKATDFDRNVRRTSRFSQYLSVLKSNPIMQISCGDEGVHVQINPIRHVRKLVLNKAYLQHSVLNAMGVLQELELFSCVVDNDTKLNPRTSLKSLKIARCTHSRNDLVDLMSSPNIEILKLVGIDVDLRIIFSHKNLYELCLVDCVYDSTLEAKPEMFANLAQLTILDLYSYSLPLLWDGFDMMIEHLPSLECIFKQVSNQRQLDAIAKCKKLRILCLQRHSEPASEVTFPEDFPKIESLYAGPSSTIFKSSGRIFELDELMFDTEGWIDYCNDFLDMIKSINNLKVVSKTPTYFKVRNPEIFNVCKKIHFTGVTGTGTTIPLEQATLDKIFWTDSKKEELLATLSIQKSRRDLIQTVSWLENYA